MKTTWRRCCLPVVLWLASVFAPMAGAQSAEPRIDSLQWMAGHWIERRASGDAEEVWLAPRGGVMLAVSRTLRQGRVDFEFLRIAEADGRLTYFASPRGRPPVPFAAVESAAERIVFENSAHDFPQRISYWREGDALIARIEGPGPGGKPRSLQWKFVRAP